MIITLHHVPVNVLEGVIRIMTGNSWSRSQDSLWEFLTEMICMKWKHSSIVTISSVYIEIYDEHHLYNTYMYRYINWPVLYLNAYIVTSLALTYRGKFLYLTGVFSICFIASIKTMGCMGVSSKAYITVSRQAIFLKYIVEIIFLNHKLAVVRAWTNVIDFRF